MSERQRPGETPCAVRDSNTAEFVEKNQPFEQIASRLADGSLNVGGPERVGNDQSEIDLDRRHRGNSLELLRGRFCWTSDSLRHRFAGDDTRAKGLKIDFNAERGRGPR